MKYTFVFVLLASTWTIADNAKVGVFSLGQCNAQKTILFCEGFGNNPKWNDMVECAKTCANDHGIGSFPLIRDSLNELGSDCSDKTIVSGSVSVGKGYHQKTTIFTGRADILTWSSLSNCLEICGHKFEIGVEKYPELP